MKKEKLEILKVRVISSLFVAVALAVFKSFGLAAWQWQAYMHLFNIFVLGVIVCLFTDYVVSHIGLKNMTSAEDADIIIRRNLWFQLINTPLIALMICIYRHFVLSDKIEGNQLSWGNFFETLLIIAFCSFAIGLYWRFKFRSQYLAAELEETKLLNEQLKKLQQVNMPSTKENDNIEVSALQNVTQVQPLSASRLSDPTPSTITLTGSTSETINLLVPNLLYVEAVGNYVKIFQLREGKVHNDMLRATSKQIEDDLRPYPMVVRCHRSFLVNLGQVEQIVSKSGAMQLLMKHCHDYLPVSRSNTTQVKEALKMTTC